MHNTKARQYTALRSRKKIAMKKTTIYLRAYCTNFELTIAKKDHLSLEEAQTYVEKYIIETAVVIKVTQLLWNGESVITNPQYKDPTQFEFKARRVA